MIEVKAPNQYHIDSLPIVFMAGSIEMGTAENWQAKVVEAMCDYGVIILNPRRDDWDSSWVQNIDNPQFKKQVTWELDGIEDSDIVIFYFDPNTKSPITLMELGMMASFHPSNTIVCCPDGFWRKGNVEIVCERYGFKMFPTLEELICELQWRVNGMGGTY